MTRSWLLALGALFLSTAIATPACAPGDATEDELEEDEELEEALSNDLDLVDYILPSCGARSAANQVGSEKFFTIPMGTSGGKGRFLVMKSQSGDGFEEWAVDANYFYIRLDTTWAYQQPNGEWCDTQCGNSFDYACRRRWAGESGDYAYTVYHDRTPTRRPTPSGRAVASPRRASAP